METMDLTKTDKQRGFENTGAGSIPDMAVLGDTAKENAGAVDVATLRSKYEKQDGKVYEIKTSVQEDDETETEFDFIFRKPNTSSYDRYVKTTATSASRALKVFVLDNICEEQKDLLRSTLEEYPAMAIGIGEKLLNMLGLSKETTVKKL